MTTAARVRMPAFAGATGWLNSEPLGPADLLGHVVLVDFWTLTCINWLRTEAYVRAWSRAYRDDGLIVVGVHTPEFSFEHDVETVRAAVQARAIDYPVALDNDYAVWNAFDNHFWPALYFIDADGVIQDSHFGEGRYGESEREIQSLLGIDRAMVPVEPTGVEADAEWENLRTTETYLGFGQARNFASPSDGTVNERRTYQPPPYLQLGQWALDGDWTIDRERVVLGEAGGSIGIRFQARDAHLVLSPGAHGPIPFRVFLDGEPPGAAHGVDVDEEGDGMLHHGRLYQLIRQPDGGRERILEIAFQTPGAQAYAFTFG